MSLTTKQIKDIVMAMGFAPVDGTSGVCAKTYPQHNSYTIRVDFAAGHIEYVDVAVDETSRILVNDGTTSNFSHPENFVVLECVVRLLDKGYAPDSVELEKVYPSGRGHSGRLDVLVKDTDGKPFLMIECKTWGTEYNKERDKMLKDGGQLFTYYKNATATKHLCLYTSHLSGDGIEYVNSIVDVQDEWVGLSETRDIYEYWNKTFKDNGIFECYAMPYNIIHKRLTYGMLQNLRSEDSSKIYNHIMEILRHNGISDKPNAFNKLLNLFVCKIIDEDKNPDDELQFQCWESLSDEDLQITLNDLYKVGMWRFLNIDVIDHSMEEVAEKLEGFGNAESKSAVLDIIKDLRLKKSPNFAFLEVLDDKTFKLNAKVVREIVELLQGYKFRYEQKHEFLGNFFELLLNTSMKQEAGQYFTPVPITRFIISALPLKEFVQGKIDAKSGDPLPAVIDYACGSGHFLTEFMSKMQTIIETVDISKAAPRVRGKLNSWRGDVKFSWADEFVYGIDFDNRLVKTTKVSAFFNGDGEATIVWGNGLDNFERSEEYRNKLKKTLPGSKKDNGQFDILISNPPYSVQAFKSMLKYGADSFDLYSSLTDNSSEIECLFVERMKQLLKIGGWAGVILPSSMLSNSGIYSRTREIIFKYFKVKAIVELGSGTFMKTGTNTVILFLERRADNEHEKIAQAIDTFFKDGLDVTVAGVEYAFSKFVANVYDGLGFNDYVSFVNGKADSVMKTHELWLDYVREFGDDPYARAFEVEREKMLYFLLTCKQNIVVVKSGQKQEEKAFLGYEFSERRGYEGIKPLPGGTKLFDESGDVLNPQKVNSYIYNAFLEKPTFEIDEAVAQHVSYGHMSDFFDYGTNKFDRRVNLSMRHRFISTCQMEKLDRLVNIIRGVTYSKDAQVYNNTGNIVLTADNITLDGDFDISKLIYLRDGIRIDDNKRLHKDDIFICFSSGSKAHVGKCAHIGKNTPYYAGGFMGILRKANESIDMKYLCAVLSSAQFRNIIANKSFGGNIQNLSNQIGNMKIPLPSLDVQQKIVAEFEILDSEIKLTRESIERLYDKIKSKFVEVFGDPVRNEKEWEVKPLGMLGTLKNGMNFSRHDSGVTIRCLGVGDFQSLNKIEDTGNLSEISLNEMPASDYLLQDGDIVFVRSNGNKALVGRSVVVWPGETPTTFSGFCIRLRITMKELDITYLIHLLHHTSIKERLLSNGHGTNITNLNQQTLSALVIPLPPFVLQTRFAEFVQQVDKTEFKLKQTLNELYKKRTDLLKKYL